jgi:hypothetical protein
MNISFLTNDIKDFIHTQVDVVKLKAVGKIEKVIANTILAVALAFLGFLILLFLSISAALAISSYAEKPFLGFLLVGLFYAVLAACVVAFKQKILNAPIINNLLSKVKYKR